MTKWKIVFAYIEDDLSITDKRVHYIFAKNREEAFKMARERVGLSFYWGVLSVEPAHLSLLSSLS